MKRFLSMTAGAVLLFGLAGSAQAVIVVDHDIGDVAGDMVARADGGVDQTDIFNGAGAADGGTMTSKVWMNDMDPMMATLYTYTYEVPAYDGGGEATTDFRTDGAPAPDTTRGYTPETMPLGSITKAGWDYDQADMAGGDGDSGDFVIHWSKFPSLANVILWTTADDDMELSGSPNWWTDPTKKITFFFQSIYAPGQLRHFLRLTEDTGQGEALGYSPAPEPSTLLLMGTGLLAAGALRRRRGGQTAA